MKSKSDLMKKLTEKPVGVGLQGGLEMNEAMKALQEKHKRQVPIRKGCPNQQCYCTGACQEIIGWRDKIQGEY